MPFIKRLFFGCSCYFTNNLFLKEFNMHFLYESKEQFLQNYQEELQSRGYKNRIDSIITKLEEEVHLRKNHQNESYERKCLIRDNYHPLHHHLYTMSVNFLEPQFLKLWESARASFATKGSISQDLQYHQGRMYSFPTFQKQFCDELIVEIKNFDNSTMPKGRPNTMNKYGINLSELGFDLFLNELRLNYLSPLTKILYPEWGGDELDSQKAFIVNYKAGEDVDLSYHYDNAEITLNISLNDNYQDGDLYFGPMRSKESSVRTGYQHKKGYGLLHRGQQMHGALPISEGERYNLIIWLRSSKIRNLLCPMCNQPPKLIPVSHGTGDGFTVDSVDLCTAL